MSAVDSKKQSIVEEIKKTKLLCQNIEAELKKKKLALGCLHKSAEEMSKKMDGLKFDNQVLMADIELSKATSAQVDFDIAQTKTQIEKIMVEILNIESQSKQCELNNKLFEQSTLSMREQGKQL